MSTVWFWIVLGFALIVLELFIPGLVVIFLGAGALIVAFLQWIGLLESWPASISAWIGSSVLFLVFLRGLCKKFLPGEVSKGNVDEDDEAFGAVVDVMDTVRSDNAEGRIKFRGTTWSAKCIEGKIKAGEKAKIVYRDNMTWIVEQYFALPADEEEELKITN